MQQLTNRTFDEIEVGASDTVVRTLTATDVEALALAAGDVETFHLDLAPGAVAEIATAPGAAAVALVAGVLNRRLPGPGSAIVGTQFTYAGQGARRRYADGQRHRARQARRRPPHRIRLPLHQRRRRRAGRRRRDGRRAVEAHRLHEHRHARGRAAAKRRPRAAACSAAEALAPVTLRRRPSVRLRLADGGDRVREARADRAGARRSRGEDPRRRG